MFDPIKKGIKYYKQWLDKGKKPFDGAPKNIDELKIDIRNRIMHFDAKQLNILKGLDAFEKNGNMMVKVKVPHYHMKYKKKDHFSANRNLFNILIILETGYFYTKPYKKQLAENHNFRFSVKKSNQHNELLLSVKKRDRYIKMIKDFQKLCTQREKDFTERIQYLFF
jgi:hypothetical protein